MHTAVHDLETECLVCALRSLILDQCIRAHFSTVLRTGPIFRGTHQLSTDTLFPE